MKDADKGIPENPEPPIFKTVEFEMEELDVANDEF